jgi:hypothetical protein
MALLGLVVGALAGAAILRRRTALRDRAELYFDDGSMISLTNGSPGAAQLLSKAHEIIRHARA